MHIRVYGVNSLLFWYFFAHIHIFTMFTNICLFLMFLCTVYAHNIHLSTSVPVVSKGEFLEFSENSTQLFSSGTLVNKVYICACIVYINICAIIHILPKKKECIYNRRKNTSWLPG